jgi:c-di-GMP-binding flagellar brake protein YcgR
MGFLLQMLGLGKRQSPAQLRHLMPSIHSFVDCTVRGGPRGQICFEGLNAKAITTSKLDGMAAGQTAVLTYTCATGKYSFASTVTNVGSQQATLAMPSEIKVLEQFAGARQRTAHRIDTTVNVQWRFTPTGKIATAYQKATLSDLSRLGAQLTLDRELKVGAHIDVNAPIGAENASVLMHGEVRRVEGTRPGKFNAGLRFNELKPEIDRAINDFINRRQRDLRNRGLA